MEFLQCGILKVESHSDDITTYYRKEECPSIEKSVYSFSTADGTESMTFYDRRNGKKTVTRKMKFISKTNEYERLCGVYNAQYGIAVSHDGSRFFTSVWEGGVYCFSADDFSMIWKNPKGRVRSIFTRKDDTRIFCVRDGTGLMILDSETGGEIGKMTGTYASFFRLDEDTFIMGEKRGYYYIYRFDDFSEICRIKKSDVIDIEGDWVVRDIYLKGNTLYFDAFSWSGDKIFEYTIGLV